MVAITAIRPKGKGIRVASRVRGLTVSKLEFLTNLKFSTHLIAIYLSNRNGQIRDTAFERKQAVLVGDGLRRASEGSVLIVREHSVFYQRKDSPVGWSIDRAFSLHSIYGSSLALGRGDGTEGRYREVTVRKGNGRAAVKSEGQLPLDGDVPLGDGDQ